jgi:type VI secretion system protein ImpE
MNAQELFQAGKLNEAIQAAGLEVRDHPTDVRRRTFLFELLCFAGEFERAGKHLSVLSQAGTDAETGALLYRSALAAERKRQLFFENHSYAGSSEPPKSPPGTINGRAFQTLEDADPRIGARLEVFIAGEYVWLPFEHIGSVKAEKPRFLRDLLWATGLVMAGPAAKGQEFGEVLLPAQYPFSWRQADDQVRLGHVTEWLELEGVGEVPIGQKLLVIDGEDALPFLEIRELIFNSSAGEQTASA